MTLVKYVTHSFLPRIVLSSHLFCFIKTIGKRYARTDEIGVPFGITIDFDTVQDKTITLRERDSTAQVRVPVRLIHYFLFSFLSHTNSFSKLDDLTTVLRRLINGHIKWEDVWNKYPHVEAKKE
jgi:glycyl-tRNA synthetase